MNRTGVIYGINGPVVYIKGNTGFKMAEMVYVGKEKLVGEVIGLDKDRTTIQVFEETTGIKPGEIVEATRRRDFRVSGSRNPAQYFRRYRASFKRDREGSAALISAVVPS